jgi:hypothetical protein
MTIRSLLRNGLLGLSMATIGCDGSNEVSFRALPNSAMVVPSDYSDSSLIVSVTNMDDLSYVTCSRKDANTTKLNYAKSLVDVEINDNDVGFGDQYVTFFGLWEDKSNFNITRFSVDGRTVYFKESGQ